MKKAVRVSIPPSGKFHIAIVDADVQRGDLYSGRTVCGKTKGKTMAVFDADVDEIVLGHKYCCEACVDALRKACGRDAVRYDYVYGQTVVVSKLKELIK